LSAVGDIEHPARSQAQIHFFSARSPGLLQCKAPLPEPAEEHQETIMAKTSQRRTTSNTKTSSPRSGKSMRRSAKSATNAERITLLLHRPSGASLAELIKASGWQQHSLRGFKSGTLAKRKGLTVTSEREHGERRYRIVGAAGTP
jgi:hypothetical protein